MITSEWPTPEHPEWASFIVQQVEFLRKAGVVLDVFAFRGGKHPWSYLIACRRVQRKLTRHPYDLIHAQWGQSGLLALFPKKLPVVVTFHGSDVEGIVGAKGRYTISGRVLKVVSRWVASCADEVIVVSEKMARNLPRRSYHIVPGGVNLDVFRTLDQSKARRELGLPEKESLVLFGGNPSVAVKRFSLAQAAVNLLEKRFPSIRLVIMKGVPHYQVPVYMNACDALLLVSLHEGSPTVVKEALACNLPVVSTDVGDVRERIGSIEGCVVCEDDRPETIAAALVSVLSPRQRINGRQAVQDLDERLLTQKVIHVYQKAVEKAKRG